MCYSRVGRQHGKLVSLGYKVVEDILLSSRRLALGFQVIIRVKGRF